MKEVEVAPPVEGAVAAGDGCGGRRCRGCVWRRRGRWKTRRATLMRAPTYSGGTDAREARRRRGVAALRASLLALRSARLRNSSIRLLIPHRRFCSTPSRCSSVSVLKAAPMASQCGKR